MESDRQSQSFGTITPNLAHAYAGEVSPPAFWKFGLGKVVRRTWPPPRRGIARMSTRERVSPVMVNFPAAAHGLVARERPSVPMERVLRAEAHAETGVSSSGQRRDGLEDREKVENKATEKLGEPQSQRQDKDLSQDAPEQGRRAKPRSTTGLNVRGGALTRCELAEQTDSAGSTDGSVFAGDRAATMRSCARQFSEVLVRGSWLSSSRQIRRRSGPGSPGRAPVRATPRPGRSGRREGLGWSGR